MAAADAARLSAFAASDARFSPPLRSDREIFIHRASGF
jgi:hypothetical protein